jgi:hypothetical protein
MRQLIRYFLRKSIYHQLPKLRTSLKTTYDPAELDHETVIALMTGIVRDESAADKLYTERDAETAAELVSNLPHRDGPDYRARFWKWTRLLEGSYASNPDLDELKKARRLHG